MFDSQFSKQFYERSKVLKIRKKIAVTVQTQKLLIIKRPKNSVFEVCAACGATLVTPEDIARLLGKRTRDVYREIENGTLHFNEFENGRLLVCLDSAQPKKF
jgi:hypothetical protein